MFALKRLSTIDADPAAAIYGADHHIVDDLSSLRRHFRPGSLDLVVCNGIVGWGLDSADAADAAFCAATECLRPGGILMVGWNDLDEHRPFRLHDLPSIAGLEPWVFPPLETTQFLVDNAWRHVFNFYRKR